MASQAGDPDFRCLASSLLNKLEQQTHTDPRSPLGAKSGTLFLPGGTGNIEMSPGAVGNKLSQESRCGDGAGRTSAGIFHIGDVAFDQLVVGFPQGQLPETLRAAFTGLDKLPGEIFTVTEYGGGFMPESDNAGSGKGGQIDDGARFKAACIGQGIRQDQAPLGIGVENLDSAAG